VVRPSVGVASAAGGRFVFGRSLFRAASQVVAARLLADPPHFLCLREPFEAVADGSREAFDSARDFVAVIGSSLLCLFM
jgi:ABC-type taurine transport system ATPase subunit